MGHVCVRGISAQSVHLQKFHRYDSRPRDRYHRLKKALPGEGMTIVFVSVILDRLKKALLGEGTAASCDRVRTLRSGVG